jgi:hypothetical protein
MLAQLHKHLYRHGMATRAKVSIQPSFISSFPPSFLIRMCLLDMSCHVKSRGLSACTANGFAKRDTLEAVPIATSRLSLHCAAACTA